MYQAIKNENGNFVVNYLSPAFPPLPCLMEGEFENEVDAMRLAAKACGYDPWSRHEFAQYKRDLKEFRRKHNMK